MEVTFSDLKYDMDLNLYFYFYWLCHCSACHEFRYSSLPIYALHCQNRYKKVSHLIAVIAIFQKITFMRSPEREVHWRSAKMAPCCLHTVFHYFGLYKKSLAQKLSDELYFLQNSCM